MELPDKAGIIKNAFIFCTFCNSLAGILLIFPLIFISASANLSGLPVMIAPPLSAEYSLYLEIALIIRKLTTMLLLQPVLQLPLHFHYHDFYFGNRQKIQIERDTMQP